ncbi:Protein sly1, partial [Tolypocladium capitatum]
MDDDPEFASGPAQGRAAKRKRDDDPGYRPGGSTTRPTKKKRRSEGEGPLGVRRSKKDKESATTTAAVAAKED